MNKKHTTAAAFSVGLSLLALQGDVLMGQESEVPERAIAEQRLDERTKAHSIELNGDVDPSKIRLAIKMSPFLRNLDTFAGSLSESVSESGLDILRMMADREAADSVYDNVSAEGIWTDICTNVDNLDAASIARKIRSVSERFMENREARYSTGLNQLSASDLQSVYAFLDEHIAKRMRTHDTDIVGLAEELPVEFKARVKAQCAKRRADSEGNVGPKVTTKSIESD